MSNGYQHLVSSLETRYDFHSARVVAADVLGAVGIAQADSYKPAEIQKIANALGAGGSNMDSVWLALGVSPAGTAMPAAPPAAEPKAEEPKAEEPAEAKAEAPAEEKEPAKKAPAKKAAAKKAPAKKKKK